jgi:hypothetical protein
MEDTVAAPAAQIRSAFMVWMTRLWPGLLNLTREVRFAPTSGIRSAEKRLKIVMESPWNSVRALCKPLILLKWGTGCRMFESCRGRQF